MAQTQGMIGYWLNQSLQNALPGREVAAVTTQTLVCRFVERSGGTAAIGAPDDAGAMLVGRAGTLVTMSGSYP